MNTTLSATQRYLIRILRDHLHQVNSEPCEGVDPIELMTLAANHSVNGMVYYQCQRFMPPPMELRMSQLYASELYYFRNRVEIFGRIADALSAAGIPFYTVKGLDAAALYPIPDLRTMGDCDVVVHTNDKQRAHEVLLELGLRCESTNDKEWVYFQDDLEFELHDHLLYDDTANTDHDCVFADSAWEYVHLKDGTRYELDRSFHYVFLLLHLKKHIINRGAGIRLFMDVYLARRQWPLDDEWIAATLEQLGLTEFCRICEELTEYWFDGNCVASRVDTLNEMTLKVLMNGTFGFHDLENENKMKVKRLTEGRGPLWWKRFRYLIKLTFPSYETMRRGEHYRYLDGRPWLLPFFWLYRFYRSVRYRKIENGKRMVNDAAMPETVIRKYDDELKMWGLDSSDT